MIGTQRIKGLGTNGAARLADGVYDIHPRWPIRKGRKRAIRRLFWLAGVAVGFLAIAGLIWGLSQIGEVEEGD